MPQLNHVNIFPHKLKQDKGHDYDQRIFTFKFQKLNNNLSSIDNQLKHQC